MSEILCSMSLTEIARGIQDRHFSSVEVTEACLRRIEASQDTWNAFLHVEAESAMDAARGADAALARACVRGPLHGVPVAHKDVYYRAGRVATCGSRIRRSFVPDHTASVLSRLDGAGAIDLGGVNTSDSGCNPFGLNVLAGRARNPWSPDRITGGSSSGSGAAVAGGLVFASLGTDSGGSIRLPAAMCGVVGLKPTEGLVSRHGIMPLSQTLDSAGPLTRTVADCATVTGVVAGHDPLDSTTRDNSVPDFAGAIENPVAGIRVGVPTQYYWEKLSDDVRTVVDESLTVLKDEGAEIIEVSVPDPAPMDALANVIIFAEGARVHEEWLRTRRADYTPVTGNALAFGLTLPATRYIEALERRRIAMAAFSELVYSRVDVLHTPVLPGPVPTIAEVEIHLQEAGPLPLELARNTKPANFLGLPALAVPCGTTDDGMPVSFQLIGPAFSEPLLFNLGHVYQKATNHVARIPEP